MNFRILFLFAFILLTTPFHVQAKDLYVDPNGNDAVSYANNSASTPWRTIGRAAWGSTNREARNGSEAARAGDIVIVNAGTYTGVGTNSRNEILYYQENNGTAGNPITFRANGTVNLTQTGAGAMIGSYRRNYIVWDGFTINEATAASVADTGPVTVYECTGCVLQNLNINGNGDGNGRMDNHNGIRIEASNNITIKNNRIQNVYTDHNVYNGACVMTYSSQGLTIENNHFSECGSGVFIKGGPFGSQITNTSYIRYNLFENVYENRGGDLSGGCIALHAGAPYSASAPILIYQNIMKNCGWAGVRIWAFDSTNPLNNPTNAKIFNNVIDNATNGIWVTGGLLTNAGHQFWNNIITNTTGDAIAFGTTPSENVKSRFDSEHNLFYSNSSIAQDAPGTRYTLATWKATGQDSASPESVNANPLFIGPSSNNYRLQSGSPASSLGRAIYGIGGVTGAVIPVGAYITGSELIGISNGGNIQNSNPITPVTPAPTADIRINNSSTGVSVNVGTSVVISWTSTNATSCTVSPSSWSGTAGTQTVTPISSATYTISCSGAGGSVTDSVSVTVNPVVVDPVPVTPVATSTEEWVFCSNENGTCTFSGTKDVRYGAQNSYNIRTVTGSIGCNNDVFGDPILNVVKQCQYKNIVTNTTPTTTTPTTPTATTTTSNDNLIKVGDRIKTTATINVRSSAGGRIVGTQRTGRVGSVTTGPSTVSRRDWFRVNFESGVDGWVAVDYITKISTTTLSQEEILNQIANLFILIKQLQQQLNNLR
ncbi:MAG TPA: right-handed parallel beta-helix repeat-containing protein [Parcubacteria group bacterium]|nr:right-handed parallel beta-helix repeat-containing protein [Parcubacteria group bacterium]